MKIHNDDWIIDEKAGLFIARQLLSTDSDRIKKSVDIARIIPTLSKEKEVLYINPQSLERLISSLKIDPLINNSFNKTKVLGYQEYLDLMSWARTNDKAVYEQGTDKFEIVSKMVKGKTQYGICHSLDFPEFEEFADSFGFALGGIGIREVRYQD